MFSADMISAEVEYRRGIEKLNRLPASVRAAMRPAVVRNTQALYAKVKQNLSGDMINRRTGRLQSAERQEMVETSMEIFGRVWMDQSIAPYARILHQGGTIHHPGSTKFQAWKETAGWVYTHKTRPHDITIPARPYLTSAMDAMRESVVADLVAAARDGARKAA